VTPTSIALNRFGLGARPDDRIGSDPRGWLSDQLRRYEPHPASLAPMVSTREGGAVVARFNAFKRSKKREAQRQRREAAANGKAAAPRRDRGMTRSPERRAYAGDVASFYAASSTARLNAALLTDLPFTERLVHFWANHFAVGSRTGPLRALAGGFERDAIRPHILGDFRDLLHAAEQHPAMLIYLNQATSIGVDSAIGLRRAKNDGMNENLAREMMELHTLGVRSGYTQADVTELARALTGWTAPGLVRGDLEGVPGAFGFDPRRHQPGARTIMGKTYPEGGREQGEAVLDDLARHPATGRHIATKLARHFAGNPAPPAMVDRLAAAYTRSDGNLTAVYQALIASPEAWAERPLRFRTPWEWTIATMRAAGTRQIDSLTASELLTQLGQPTWRAKQPLGWDDDDASWAAPDALMRRVEAAERMAGARSDPVDARRLAETLYPGALSPVTAQALARAESPAQGLALLFVSPEMMRR
jgi:uncharacterized protein (DUF1800 family)